MANMLNFPYRLAKQRTSLVIPSSRPFAIRKRKRETRCIVLDRVVDFAKQLFLLR